MSTTRMRCGHCGFAVIADSECPLCKHKFKTDGFRSNALQVIFGK